MNEHEVYRVMNNTATLIMGSKGTSQLKHDEGVGEPVSMNKR